MSPKLIGKFTIGHLFIVLGLMSALLTFFLFKQLQPAPQKTPEQQVAVKKTKPVVVAKRYISRGEIIKPEDIVAVNWPEDFYPLQTVFQDVSAVVGHAARIDIVASQPVYGQSITGDFSLGGLRARIPKGMRAITIGVSELKGVAGFIRPGDRIDVIATFDYPGLNTGNGIPVHVTKTLVQNVEVLAVAQNMELPKPNDDLAKLSGTINQAANEIEDAKEATGKDEGKGKKATSQDTLIAASLTLAVTPEQAQVLTLSETQAQLKLVLRPENEFLEETNATIASSSEPDMLTDDSLFEKVYNYVMTQSSISGILTATAATATAAASNAAAGSILSTGGGSAMPQGMPSMGGGFNAPTGSAFGLPSPGNKVQVIEGTQVSDVYVKPR